MSLVVPVSYFAGRPRSELWRLDASTGEYSRWKTLLDSPHPVHGKGVTGMIRLPTGGYALCDFNRVLLMSEEGEITATRSRRDMNDLHSISVVRDGLLLSNTGRDSIDWLDFGLSLRRRWDGLSRAEWHSRWAGADIPNEPYYDALGGAAAFRQRRVKDRYHFNQALLLPDGRVVANSLSRRCFIDLERFCAVSESLSEPSHDGVLRDGELWITSVSGTVYRAALGGELRFQPALDLFSLVPHHGWCRGLCFEGAWLFVGVTVIQQASARTAWLRQPVTETRSGVYQIDPARMSVERFFDLSHPHGARIFSLVSASAC